MNPRLRAGESAPGSVLSEGTVPIQQAGWFEMGWRACWVLHHQAGAVSVDMLERTADSVTRYAEGRGERLLFLLIVSGPPPDSAARKAFSEFFRTQSVLDEVVVWIQRGGLLGSVVRSVATSLFLLSESATPTSFVSGEDALLDVMVRRGTKRTTARQFIDEVLAAGAVSSPSNQVEDLCG